MISSQYSQYLLSEWLITQMSQMNRDKQFWVDPFSDVNCTEVDNFKLFRPFSIFALKTELIFKISYFWLLAIWHIVAVPPYNSSILNSNYPDDGEAVREVGCGIWLCKSAANLSNSDHLPTQSLWAACVLSSAHFSEFFSLHHAAW